MKKLIALLLALVLALGLVACGGGSTTTTTPPEMLGGGETTEPETPELPAIPGEEVEEIGAWEGDYETATFDDIRKYGFGSTAWDGSLPLTTTGEQLEIGLRTNSNVTNYDTNPMSLYIEETTGVDLVFREFVGSAGDYNTQISLMFSGGEDLPDILFIGNTGNDMRGEWLEAGYLHNLAGYFMTDAYYFTAALERACKDDPVKYCTMLNNICNYTTNQQTGRMYGIPSVSDIPTDVVNMEPHINTVWLEKLDLKVPTTIDELYDVLVAFRDRDPNGNGKKDEIPLMGLTRTLGRGVDIYLINAFIQYSPTRKAMIENGKAFSFHNQDEYREALKFMNKLVKEGLMSELVFTGSGTELKRLLNPVGNEPFTVGVCCYWTNGDCQANSDSWKVYKPIPALKDATGRGGYCPFDAPTLYTNWGLTWCCENPLLAFRMLDSLRTDEAYLVQRYGKEGTDWDWIENTEYKDMAKGNGLYGGEARYVIYNDGFRINSRWFVACTYGDEVSMQLFMHPDKDDFTTTIWKDAAENIRIQTEVGAPPEQFLVFTRTPEEDEQFFEYNAELSGLVVTSMQEFAMGRRDPYSDADWNEYLKELDTLNFDLWAELAQASYDRQKAEAEAFRDRMGK